MKKEIKDWKFIHKVIDTHQKLYSSKITKEGAHMFHFGKSDSDVEDILVHQTHRFKRQSFVWAQKFEEDSDDSAYGSEEDYICIAGKFTQFFKPELTILV